MAQKLSWGNNAQCSLRGNVYCEKNFTKWSTLPEFCEYCATLTNLTFIYIYYLPLQSEHPKWCQQHIFFNLSSSKMKSRSWNWIPCSCMVLLFCTWHKQLSSEVNFRVQLTTGVIPVSSSSPAMSTWQSPWVRPFFSGFRLLWDSVSQPGG